MADALGTLVGGALKGLFGIDKRTLLATAMASTNAIFHNSGPSVGELKVRDLQRLDGLMMDVTSPENGTAIFSAAGIDPVEGTIHRHHAGHGLHKGKLTFTVPGIDVHVEARYITVTPSAGADKAVLKAFDVLYAIVEEKRREQESAEMMDALLELAEAGGIPIHPRDEIAARDECTKWKYHIGAC